MKSESFLHAIRLAGSQSNLAYCNRGVYNILNSSIKSESLKKSSYNINNVVC